MSRIKRLIAGLAGISLVLGLLAAAGLASPARSPLGPEPAAAAAKARDATHRKGILVGRQWVGTWNVWTGKGWAAGLCIQPRAGHPTSYGAGLVTKPLPGMTARQSADVKYATQTYANTASPTIAAGLNLYVWKVQDEPSFRGELARLLRSPQLRDAAAWANRIAAEAPNHGPYAKGGSVQSGQYGKAVTGALWFKNAANRPAAGKKVELTGRGITLAHRWARTDASGRVAFAGRVSTIGRYTVDGKLYSPTSSAVLMNTPSAGHQRTAIYTGAQETATVSVGNQGKTNGAKVRSDCGTNCHGSAPVDITKANECGGAPQRVFAVVNGRIVYSFDIAPCKTATKRITASDNSRVSAKVCYLDRMGGSCKTATVSTGNTIVVECPPWPGAVVNIVCDCDKAASSVTFTGPAGSRAYRGYVDVNGKVTTVVIPNGGRVTVPVGSIAGRTTIKTSFRAYDTQAAKRVLKAGSLGRPVTIG